MPTPYDPAYIPGLNPVPPRGGFDPAYPVPGSGMPPIAQPFTAGAGGIMPGTPGSMGLIPPMPQMAMPGLSPYGPALPGTQSFMPAPVGGQWNQLAQQMAGPMFMPPPPSTGIPYPHLVMPATPGGSPIATVATPKPPSTPVPLPPTLPIGPGGGTLLARRQLLGGGGQIGAGSFGGMGPHGGLQFQMVPQPMTNGSMFGLDGAGPPGLPSPFGGAGGGGGPYRLSNGPRVETV